MINGLMANGLWYFNSQPIYIFTLFTFTNGGISGATGPTSSILTTSLPGYNSIYPGLGTIYALQIMNGIQIWTVPSTGIYTFIVAGASGGFSGNGQYLGGKGAIITAQLSLTVGQTLSILVGQSGGNDTTGANLGSGGGGGGGTFIVLGTTLSSATPLLIAGGGGGAGIGGTGANATGGNATLTVGNGQGFAVNTVSGSAAYPSGSYYSYSTFINGAYGINTPVNTTCFQLGNGVGFGNGGYGCGSSGGGGNNNSSGGGGGGYTGGSGGGQQSGGGGGSCFDSTAPGNIATLYTSSINGQSSGYNTGNGFVYVINNGPLYSFTTFTFTNAGTSGPTGPTSTALTATTPGYNSIYPGLGTIYALQIINGIQYWTVPITGYYSFTLAGAGTTNSSSVNPIKTGYGIVMNISSYQLTAGTIFAILIGQQGQNANGGSGGAGGTFICSVSSASASSLPSATPYFIAGGAGGIGGEAAGVGDAAVGGANANVDATMSTTGRNGTGGNSASGGIGPNGGSINTAGTYQFADAGAGFSGNSGWGGGGCSQSFTNGGLGGTGAPRTYSPGYGGFGGGGCEGAYGGGVGGGGGGYGGGGSGSSDAQGSGGGGGGSYDITGAYAGGSGSAGGNSGQGYATITYLHA